MAVVSAPNVNVSAIPSSNYGLRGVLNSTQVPSFCFVNKRVTFCKVLLQIQTNAPETSQPRPLLELALVVDRSGSMEGERIKNAKRAVKKVIKHLSAYLHILF